MHVVTPRDYQKEALAANREARANGTNKVTNVLASGLGKTVLAGLDIREFLGSTDLVRPRVLVLNGNIQLLKQIEEEFREKVFGHEYSYGVFNGTEKTKHTTDFLFATFDSMYSHLKEFKPKDFGYIFIDEAHHAQANTYSKVIKHFHPEQQLSVTATPKRMDGKDITEICGPVVYSLELEEAIARGLTAGVDYRLCLDEIEKIQAFLDNGEAVSWNKLNTEIFVPKRDEEIIATVQRGTADLSDPTTIYFCRSIRHANRIVKLLPDATVVHSKLSVNEVDRRLRKFRRGELKTIVAVDMLNEGIDIPRTDVVVFLRSTRSWTVFLQQLGRGLRLTEGKGAVRVYDFVDTANALEKIIDLEQRVGEYVGKCEDEEKPNFELKINASKFNVTKLDIVGLLNSITVKPHRNYEDEYLLRVFKEKAIRENCIPSLKDVDTDPNMPSSNAYRHFGGIENIVTLCGLRWADFNSNWTHFTDEELSQRLRRLGEELGHPPSCKETNNVPYCPVCDTYRTRFGSFRTAKILAGFAPEGYTKEGLLDDLIEKYHELGRTPTKHEVDRDKGMACVGTYKNMFGLKWNQILEIAGIPLLAEKVAHTDEEIFAQIWMVYEKINLGRPAEKWKAPSRRAYAADNDTTVGVTCILWRFKNSWTDALLAAGIPKEQIHFKKQKQ